MVAAVNIDAVKSEGLEMGDHSSLLAIHLGLKEGIFHLALLRVRGVGEVVAPGGVPVPSGHAGIGDAEHVPPLPVRPEEQTQVQKRALERKATSPPASEKLCQTPQQKRQQLIKKLNKGNCQTRGKLSLNLNLPGVSTFISPSFGQEPTKTLKFTLSPKMNVQTSDLTQ